MDARGSVRRGLLIAALAAGVPGAGTVAQEGRSAPTPFTARLACTDETPTFTTEQAEEQVTPDLTIMRLGTPTWALAVEGSGDPRIAGEATLAMNGDLYWEGPSVAEAGDSSVADVFVATVRIQDADGAWEATTQRLALANEDLFPSDVVVFVGSGAYEGLVALASMTQGASICEWDLEGAVIDGPLPAAPLPAPE
jgi:hypothetical protein